MKKFTLIVAFLVGITGYAQTQSETLVSNIWVLDYLVVNGNEVYMPEEIVLGTDENALVLPNLVFLGFEQYEGNDYKVESELVYGGMISYHTVTDDNIALIGSMGLNATSSPTDDVDYDDFKATYLNDYAFGYSGGDYTIVNDVLTLGSETTYGVFTIYDVCDYMPIPTGNTTQEMEQGQTIADLVVTPYDDATLIWYADEELTQELTTDTVLANGATYYVVQYDDQCTSDPLVITVTIAASLSDTQMSNLALFPNPSSDIINITYTNQISNIIIYDFMSRKVLEKTINATESVVNIQMLSAGTYFINITTEDGHGVLKFIKK